MNALQKKLATGLLKKYANAEDDFTAFGTRFVGGYDMYYTAANEQQVWLCAHMGDNKPLPICLLDIKHVKRIVVDRERETAYFEIDNYEQILSEAGVTFRMYKKLYTHRMADNGAMSISVSLELLSGNILPFLSERIPMEIREEAITKEEERRSNFWNILYILVIALIFISLIARFF